jgi:predicted MFS family arabinose efflux permease
MGRLAFAPVDEAPALSSDELRIRINRDAAPRASLLTDVRALMVGLTGFCVFLSVYATQTLLPLFADLFHATKLATSLTVSATTIAIALAAPAVGLLAERIGRRRVMIGSVALLTLPILLSATAASLHAIIAWRFVQGLIMPGIIAVTMAYISEEWADGGAATVMAAYVAGNVLGGVTGRFVSGLVAAHFGWRMAFIALGCLNGLGALAVWRWLPPSSNRTDASLIRPTFTSALRDMAAHLRRPLMVATFFVGTGALFALVATFTYITFYLAAAPFSLGTAALGSLFLVYLVGVIVTPMCGRWIDQFGHRALIASALAAALGVALTLIHSLPAVMTGLALCSSGIFVCQAAASSFLGRAAGRAKSSAAGLYSTFYYGGGTAGAALPAFAWRLGGWPACVATIITALAAVIYLAATFWRDAEEDQLSSAPRPRNDDDPRDLLASDLPAAA